MASTPSPDNPSPGTKPVTTTVSPHRKNEDTIARLLVNQGIITVEQLTFAKRVQAKRVSDWSLAKLPNKGCHKIGLGLSVDASLILPTTAEAQFLGTDEITLAEFEIMIEDQFLGSNNP